MIPWHRLIVTAGLAFLAVGVLGATRADDRPRPAPPKVDPPNESPKKTRPDYPPNATDADKREIDLVWVRYHTGDDEMRKNIRAAFPFESLEDRLKFDAPGRKRVAKSFPTGDLELDKWERLSGMEYEKITPAAVATLQPEDRLRREGAFDRMRALASVHQLEVKRFVTNPGFGDARMWFRLVEDSEKPPTRWSEGDRGEPVTLPTTGDFFSPSADKKGPTLPSVPALVRFHVDTAREFSRPDSWGLVKDKTQVAGFLPHALEFVPGGGIKRAAPGTPGKLVPFRPNRQRGEKEPIKDKDGEIIEYPLIERWAVRRVELIGLLMHDAPVVYLNPENKLPTMAGAKGAKTRAPTAFESGGLRDLSAGKETVILDATTNQVRMVGAIRMANACTKCHEGARGDLLGAFTYDLVREPAFVPPQK